MKSHHLPPKNRLIITYYQEARCKRTETLHARDIDHCKAIISRRNNKMIKSAKWFDNDRQPHNIPKKKTRTVRLLAA